MRSYHKYLPVSTTDKKWGIYTLNVGYDSFNLSSSYPRKNHPHPYYFKWANGRVLSEYQVIYITHGQGVFESKSSGSRKIDAGCIIMLFPGEWHRYKPNDRSGWNEYWVGFNGSIADNLIRNHFFSPAEPMLHVGYREEIINMFNDITERVRSELIGYQQLISGEILHLLGYLHAVTRENAVDGDKKYIEQLVQKAQLVFRENMDAGITPERVAEDLGVGYSYFRKVFKKYTGIPPGQYLIQLKMERAKLLLLTSDEMIKQVAYGLGFDSCFYFSRLFKEKTGFSPADYRVKCRSHHRRKE